MGQSSANAEVQPNVQVSSAWQHVTIICLCGVLYSVNLVRFTLYGKMSASNCPVNPGTVTGNANTKNNVYGRVIRTVNAFVVKQMLLHK